MEVFSLKFLLILAVAVAFLTLRARRKRKGPTIVRGKQISIRGQKLITPITKTTPLPCLIDEGRTFGEDFKEKTPLNLPHCEECTCELVPIFRRSHDWFNQKGESVEMFKTELGELNRNEFRYCKYSLIINHSDANDNLRIEYRELLEKITVSDAFKQQVQTYLSSTSS